MKLEGIKIIFEESEKETRFTDPIKDLFTQTFNEEYKLLTEYLQKKVITITFQLSGETADKRLAALNLSRCADEMLCITIYPWVLEKMNTEEAQKALSTVLMHELMHAMDLQILRENHKEFRSSKKVFLNNDLLRIRPVKENEMFSIHWTFLNFLATIRNEGVAILGQKLLHDSLELIPVQEAFEMFKKDLELIIATCSAYSFHNRISGKEVKSLIETVKPNIYLYADSLMAELTNLHSFSGKKTRGCNLDIAGKIQFMINTDLSEWINEVLILTKDDLGQPMVSADLIFEYNVILNDKEDFYTRDLLGFACNNQRQQFVEYISVHTRKDLKPFMLNELLHDWFEKESTSDILNDIKDLAFHLLKNRNDENREVVDLALAYLLTDKDIIKDQSAFLGLQDDWLVLESASILIKNI